MSGFRKTAWRVFLVLVLAVALLLAAAYAQILRSEHGAARLLADVSSLKLTQASPNDVFRLVRNYGGGPAEGVISFGCTSVGQLYLAQVNGAPGPAAGILEAFLVDRQPVKDFWPRKFGGSTPSASVYRWYGAVTQTATVTQTRVKISQTLPLTEQGVPCGTKAYSQNLGCDLTVP